MMCLRMEGVLTLVPEHIEVSGLALESNNLHSTVAKLDVAVKL